METTIIQTRPLRRGLVYVMIASTLWGTSGVASQALAQLTQTNPLSISALRLATAAPLLLLAAWHLLGRQLWSATRRDLGLILLYGVLMAVDQALYFAAIALTGVTLATLITICSAPVLVTVFTALYERKMPSRFTLVIIAMALLGTVILVGSGTGQTANNTSSLLGVAYALAAACVYAGVIFLSKFLSGKYLSLQITALGFSAGAVCLLVVAKLVGFVGRYPAQGWLIILYMGAVPTALAYGLFMLGMRTTSAPAASVLVLLEPLTAAVLSWLLLGERLTPLGIAGAVMLLGAIYALARAE
jgi:drug/metabolite transporter, DME family